MYKKILASAILFNVFLLTGCGAKVPFSQENARKIKTIYVQPQIKKPEHMTYVGRALKTSISFGLVPMLITKPSNDNDMKAIEQWAQVVQTNLSDMVYQQWVKQLSQTNFKTQKPADAVLTIDILSYGLESKGAFSSRYAPSMKQQVTLIKDNKIVWQDVSSVTVWDGRYTIDEMKKDPKKLQEEFKRASEILIASLIRQLKK